MKREGLLLGIGNPLLDISANADDLFLEKYGLDPNNAILADSSHANLYEDMEKHLKVEYFAGGATQNSMRVAQWILKQPLCCSFMGCVGKDKYSATLEEKAREAGVNVKYDFNENHPTGTCAVIVTKNGTCRSLVANLAAANHFNPKHLELPENEAIIQRARFFYISGFFLTVSPMSIVRIGQHACQENKTFMMNLSAPFLCEFFTGPMMEAFPYIDILFGNETEAEKFSEVHNFGTKDVSEIARKVCNLPKKNSGRARTVVFTQGPDNVVVVQDGVVKTFPAAKIPQEKLVDTNGAGDAFVGGFLSQLIQEKSLEESVKCGIWAATEVIQQSGCTFPESAVYLPQ